jgi:hypothetical protein
MSFSVKKEKGELIFKDFGGYESRNPSTIWCIIEADKLYKWRDFKEIVIHTKDFESNEYDYTYSKQKNPVNLVPDFSFHAWPQVGINDYNDFVKEIDIAGKHAYELNKVGWIGNASSHVNRDKLIEIGSHNRDLFDFFDMRWMYSGNTLLGSTNYISTPDLVKKYAIIIDIEGHGWSARLKQLLWSHRPLILVDRPHKEYFFEHLKEWEHYIPVKRDLSDLVEKTKWCLTNYYEALKIAENAYQFAKLYLTREACYKQWNTLITSTQCSYKIIVSRYDENIDWLASEMDNCIIFNKGSPLHVKNEVFLKNVGHESDTYLNYIINEYNNLPEIVVFTQARISDHFEDGNVNYLLNIKNEAAQKNKSKPWTYFKDSRWVPIMPDFNLHLPNYVPECYLNNNKRPFYEWFEEIIGMPYPDPIKFYICGVFAIKKELILKKPLQYYKELIKHVNYHNNPAEGHFFERSWYYIFS